MIVEPFTGLIYERFRESDAPALAALLADPSLIRNITSNVSTPERCPVTACNDGPSTRCFDGPHLECQWCIVLGSIPHFTYQVSAPGSNYRSMQAKLQPLLCAVQRNCHISDARHAGDYALCTYLLKMREYFRWEQRYTFRDSLPEGAVGDWLTQREDFWETIEDEAFTDLPIDGRYYDPFDSESVNAALDSYGLVYSGGLGNKRVPHFFLGKLDQRQTQTDFTVFVSENEYARDLTAPPAMSLGDTIFIRRESLRRMIWEKIEEWQWSRLENAMGRVLQGFNLEDDIEAAVDEISDSVIESLLMHEQGEVLAGKILGPEWERMLTGLPRSNTEFMVRAVRDHLADSLTTLPGLLAGGKAMCLHFYFANLPAMHKHLFPALVTAYDSWVTQGQRSTFAALLPASKTHWSALASQILDVYRSHPDDYSGRLQTLIENNQL